MTLLTADDPRHGTRSAYIRHKCRCPRCVKANSRYIRRWRRDKSARNRARGTAEIIATRNRLRPDGVKRCRWCGKSKTFDQFYQELASDDGLKPLCNVCSYEIRVLFPKVWTHFYDTRAVAGVVWCVYCRENVATQIDHYYPLNKGGTSELNNMVPACLHCNASKRDRDPVEWMSENGFLIYEPADLQEAAAMTGR